MHQLLIASELSRLGFTTRITSSGVLVSLNRAVSRMEVETALRQAFEKITFTLTRISKNSYHISEE